MYFHELVHFQDLKSQKRTTSTCTSTVSTCHGDEQMPSAFQNKDSRDWGVGLEGEIVHGYYLF